METGAAAGRTEIDDAASTSDAVQTLEIIRESGPDLIAFVDLINLPSERATAMSPAAAIETAIGACQFWFDPNEYPWPIRNSRDLRLTLRKRWEIKKQTRLVLFDMALAAMRADRTLESASAATSKRYEWARKIIADARDAL